MSSKFDLEKVFHSFSNSLKGDDDICTDYYLEGYKEVNKFFHLMGTVFGFVSNDVKSKVEILEQLRLNRNGEDFETFKQMFEHEKSTGLLVKQDYVSGSRTLLRLHRGLDFIRNFLNEISKLKSEDKTSNVCQAAYNSTLAKYHPWIIRKGAIVAMYAMPTQGYLLNKVCVDVEKAIQVLPQMLEITKIVYDRTENLFTIYELHELP